MGEDWDGRGYVYLIRQGDGWYKIGRTGKPEERFRQIRWEYGRNKSLQLLCLMEVLNQASAERLFFRAFAHCRSEEHHRGLGPCKELFALSRADLVTFSAWAEIIALRVHYVDIVLTDDDWLAQFREMWNAIEVLDQAVP